MNKAKTIQMFSVLEKEELTVHLYENPIDCNCDMKNFQTDARENDDGMTFNPWKDICAKF